MKRDSSKGGQKSEKAYVGALSVLEGSLRVFGRKERALLLKKEIVEIFVAQAFSISCAKEVALSANISEPSGLCRRAERGLGELRHSRRAEFQREQRNSLAGRASLSC